jgi:hypothetical protein
MGFGEGNGGLDSSESDETLPLVGKKIEDKYSILV